MSRHPASPSRLQPLRHPLPWIALLALAVRLLNLTYHSLWFDEVMSTVWASRPAGEIWRVGLALSLDKHPPLYYLLLRGWTGLWGTGDGAVRSLGAVLGALAVLPAYGIGALLGGRRAAGLGALLLALSPFLVWYSQEARMFMPATTFGLVGLYGVLRLADSSRPASLRAALLPPALMVLGFTAALYTYLFSAFLLPVAGVWLLLAWWQDRGRPGRGGRLAAGAAALGLVALLFLPLARAAWQVSGSEALPGRAFEGMARSLRWLLQVYGVGWPAWPQALPALATALLALLALIGLLVPAVPRQPSSALASSHRPIRCGIRCPIRYHGGLYLAIWLLLPLLLGGLLLARDRTVFAESRYFIFLVPALGLAWGRGLAALLRRQLALGLAAVALIVGLTAAALPADWAPQNRREAWREAAALLQDLAGPGDAVLVHADFVQVALARYLAGPQPLFFPFTDPLVDPELVDAQLQGLVNAGFDGIWLVQSHHEGLDPDQMIAGWLAARFPLISEAYPAGIAIRGYATRYRLAALPPGPAAEPVRLGPVQLLSCRFDPGPLSAQDDLYHPPSGWLHVTTYWTAPEPVAADLHPSIRLVDGLGQVWGDRLERANDTTHLWPTSRWLPGEVVRLDSDVNLNPATPPGRYRVAVGTGQAGEEVICGEVDVD